jgi:glucose-fructose oxidoreductase
MTKTPIAMRMLSAVVGTFFLFAGAERATAEPPIRVAIVGLVHGHVKGFLAALPGNQAATLVAIVEPQEAIAKEYAAKYHLHAELFYTDLEKMLVEQHPDAVLVYSTIVDHRKVIEAAARHGVSSMVEKPLATTLEDALAIRAVARESRTRERSVQVLVNYETTWYASNREVLAQAAAGKLGELRKVVVHDGHKVPRKLEWGRSGCRG